MCITHRVQKKDVINAFAEGGGNVKSTQREHLPTDSPACRKDLPGLSALTPSRVRPTPSTPRQSRWIHKNSGARPVAATVERSRLHKKEEETAQEGFPYQSRNGSALAVSRVSK